VGFPPYVGKDGRVAWSEGPDNIRECIRIILSTEPGERLMLPTFGAGLKRFLFEPNTVSTHRLMQECIVQALERWEPRIRVESVDVNVADDDDQAVIVIISYGLITNGLTDRVQVRVQLDEATG
ncbi:MAG: phage tail protein, partial [Chitinivibrionales bacterium]|nr:phage tail protein [Chitinivibrionales bacterium]MBD3357578.1 phage tail protein [Chitinivibrionales bacterium]